MTGAPQFGVALDNWNVSPRLDDKTFTFEAPPEARKVEVLNKAIPVIAR